MLKTTLADVKPNPLPDEHDYSWYPVELKKNPETGFYRDLPIVGGNIFDESGAIISALKDFEVGLFQAAGYLVDAMGYDDRIDGVLQTRVDALAGLPASVVERHGGTDKKIVDEVHANWATWLPQAEIKKLHRWGLLFRLGLGELIWDTSGDTWTPRLKVWDPRHLMWRWDTRTFWLTTMDGQVEVTPGDGHWVLYAPDGYARGWLRGLIRSLAFCFLSRRWAWRDWNRHSEVHGQPIKKAQVPAGASTEDKDGFRHDLENLAAEGVVILPSDAQGNKFDLNLMEATSQGWECFSRLIDKVDECIAVDVLGQNLSTSAKSGGSYSLGEVQDRIRLDRLESDAQSLGSCLTKQVLEPWAFYNYGSKEAAPLLGWSTKAPEDRSKVASTWAMLGDAIQKMRDSGFNLDLDEIARIQQVPVSGQGEVLKYKQLDSGQITSLMAVLESVRTGRILKPIAISVLQIALPGSIDESRAHELVDPIEVKEENEEATPNQNVDGAKQE